MCNKCQRSKIQAVEMSYLRGGCGVNRMDGKNNERIFSHRGQVDMSMTIKGRPSMLYIHPVVNTQPCVHDQMGIK